MRVGKARRGGRWICDGDLKMCNAIFFPIDWLKCWFHLPSFLFNPFGLFIHSINISPSSVIETERTKRDRDLSSSPGQSGPVFWQNHWGEAHELLHSPVFTSICDGFLFLPPAYCTSPRLRLSCQHFLGWISISASQGSCIVGGHPWPTGFFFKPIPKDKNGLRFYEK